MPKQSTDRIIKLVDELRIGSHKKLETDAYDKMYLDVLEATLETGKSIDDAIQYTTNYFSTKFDRLIQFIKLEVK